MSFLTFISTNLWEIIVSIIGIIYALFKFNINLFDRAIKSEVENNNLKLKEEIRNDLEKQIRHEVRNQLYMQQRNNNDK